MAVDVLDIVGCGPGAREYLTREAERVVADADLVAGPERLLRLFPEDSGRKVPWSGDADAFISTLRDARNRGLRTAALVSGDVGAFSLAARLVSAFGRENCRLHPGVSSFQLAFARLCVPWENARLVHAHGEAPGISPEALVSENAIAVALDAGAGWRWFLGAAARLLDTHDLSLCANLSLDDEKIVAIATMDQLASMTPPRLAVAVFLRRRS